ncbi:hypothetical protein KJ640_03010 [bacterium]|nr:hypothetical protein [bacterium]
MNIVDMKRLKQIAEVEFEDIVAQVEIGLNRARIILTDTSYIDVWYSLNIEGRYSYHWERKWIDGSIYRHNNAPHQRWMGISTFPKHFHYMSELNVIESDISDNPETAIRELLAFAQEKGKSK